MVRQLLPLLKAPQNLGNQMHPYELQIMEFMKTVATQSLDISNLVLKPATKDIEHYLRKMYEDDPHRPFTIRMSNIGRPICQLQMEQAKAEKVADDWNFPLRMMYGGVTEGLVVSVLRHAGINIEEEQTPVKLPIMIKHPKAEPITINGTLDLVIDGRVWDIKSASPHSFQNKFASYQALKEDDTFGYLCQLYGYAKARDLPAGGFIVNDKSSGEIKVLAVPDNWEEEQAHYLSVIFNNVKILATKEQFKRCFTDKDETYKKKFTGNKVLESTCGFCKYRYSCWPGLQYLPSMLSTAYDKPYKHYTKVTNENTVC